MSLPARTLLFLALVVCTAGCRYRGYDGDGAFVDHGFLSYSDRYDIDFGPIDLSREGAAYAFELRRLPDGQFTVGIELAIPDSPKRKKPDEPGRIHLEVRDSHDAIVMSESRPLAEWTWMTAATGPAYLYMRGESREVQVGDDPKKTRFEKLGIKSSQGWGTYFEPSTTETYSLKLRVLSPSGFPQTARLKVHGWDD